MYIKLKDSGRIIGRVYCFENTTQEIKDGYKDEVKELVENGVKLNIYSDGEWIDGKEYFADKKVDTNDTETDNNDEDNKVDEETNDNDNVDIPFEELFDTHWRKRVDSVKEYTDNSEVVTVILEYAKENGQPDSVLEGIIQYLETL